jgi:hypothetical protein
VNLEGPEIVSVPHPFHDDDVDGAGGGEGIREGGLVADRFLARFPEVHVDLGVEDLLAGGLDEGGADLRQEWRAHVRCGLEPHFVRLGRSGVPEARVLLRERDHARERDGCDLLVGFARYGQRLADRLPFAGFTQGVPEPAGILPLLTGHVIPGRDDRLQMNGIVLGDPEEMRGGIVSREPDAVADVQIPLGSSADRGPKVEAHDFADGRAGLRRADLRPREPRLLLDGIGSAGDEQERGAERKCRTHGNLEGYARREAPSIPRIILGLFDP